MLFIKVYKYRKMKVKFCAQESKTIASLMKMCSTLKVPLCIIEGVLAIICSNSFSNCQVDQKKTIAISQMFNHEQLYVH